MNSRSWREARVVDGHAFRLAGVRGTRRAWPRRPRTPGATNLPVLGGHGDARVAHRGELLGEASRTPAGRSSVRPYFEGLKPSIGPSRRWSGSMPPPPYTLRPASVCFRSAADRSRGVGLIPGRVGEVLVEGPVPGPLDQPAARRVVPRRRQRQSGAFADADRPTARGPCRRSSRRRSRARSWSCSAPATISDALALPRFASTTRGSDV